MLNKLKTTSQAIVRAYAGLHRNARLLLFVLGFGIVGSIVILFTHAFGTYGIIEAENGTYGGNVNLGTDDTAGVGRYALFGTANYSGYKGEYYTNRTLSGDPVITRDDPTINFNWGTGSPAPELPVDGFSVRWTKTISFSSNIYRFSVTTDDGVRLYIDNNLVIDKWIDQGPTTYTYDTSITTVGDHTIKMEYYENTGGASAAFTYAPISSPPPNPADPPPLPAPGWTFLRQAEISLTNPIHYLDTFWNMTHGFNKIEVDVTVEVDSGNDSYYASNTVYFPNLASCTPVCLAYMGLLGNDTSGLGNKIARFSAWMATAGVPGPGASMVFFTNDGPTLQYPGVGFALPFSWQPNRTYRLIMELDNARTTGSETWWKAGIYDTFTGAYSELGSARMPVGYRYADTAATFHEQFFGDTSACSLVGPSVISYANMKTYYPNGSTAVSNGGYFSQANVTGCNYMFRVDQLSPTAHRSVIAGDTGSDTKDPSGHLDAATCSGVWGWAYDSDYLGPIETHIYIDGQLASAAVAGDYRADVGSHGFNYTVPGNFRSSGTHTVQAYAINYSYSSWISGVKNAFIGQQTYSCP